MMAKVSIHITMELIHTCIRLFKFFTYQLKKNFDCSGPIFLLINVDRFCLVIAMTGTLFGLTPQNNVPNKALILSQPSLNVCF